MQTPGSQAAKSYLKKDSDCVQLVLGGRERGALSVQWDNQYPFLPPPHPVRNNELGLDFVSATDPMSELCAQGGPKIGGHRCSPA